MQMQLQVTVINRLLHELFQKSVLKVDVTAVEGKVYNLTHLILSLCITQFCVLKTTVRITV